MKAGDVVRLKGGKTPMTVVAPSLYEDKKCVVFYEAAVGGIGEACLPKECFVPWEEKESPEEQEKEVSSLFHVGDVVRLNGGKIPMTVTQVDQYPKGAEYVVMFFLPQQRRLSEKCLVLAEESESPEKLRKKALDTLLRPREDKEPETPEEYEAEANRLSDLMENFEARIGIYQEEADCLRRGTTRQVEMEERSERRQDDYVQEGGN